MKSVPGIIIPKARLDGFRAYTEHQGQYGFADSPYGPNAQILRGLADTDPGDRLVIRRPDAQRLLLVSAIALGLVDPNYRLDPGQRAVVASLIGGPALAAEIDGISPPLPKEAIPVGLAFGAYLMPVAATLIR